MSGATISGCLLGTTKAAAPGKLLITRTPYICEGGCGCVCGCVLCPAAVSAYTTHAWKRAIAFACKHARAWNHRRWLSTHFRSVERRVRAHENTEPRKLCTKHACKIYTVPQSVEHKYGGTHSRWKSMRAGSSYIVCGLDHINTVFMLNVCIDNKEKCMTRITPNMLPTKSKNVYKFLVNSSVFSF